MRNKHKPGVISFPVLVSRWAFRTLDRPAKALCLNINVKGCHVLSAKAFVGQGVSCSYLRNNKPSVLSYRSFSYLYFGNFLYLEYISWEKGSSIDLVLGRLAVNTILASSTTAGLLHWANWTLGVGHSDWAGTRDPSTPSKSEPWISLYWVWIILQGSASALVESWFINPHSENTLYCAVQHRTIGILRLSDPCTA